MSPLMILLRVIISIVTAIAIFKISDYVLVLPSGTTKKTTRYMFGEKSFKERLKEFTVYPLSRTIARSIHITDYKRRRMVSDFERIGYTATPEEFIAKNIAQAVLIAGLGLIFILFDLAFASVMMAILALVNYTRANKKVTNQIQELNEQIETELPRLVETLNLAQTEDRDLIRFFEQYLKVAGPAMRHVLQQLVLEMKTGNIEQALRDFDARVQVPQLSAFVATLLGVTHGVDQRTVLIVMEKDLRARQREALRRKASKRPGKVRVANIALVFGMILLMMIPLVVVLIGEFGGMGF